MREIRVAYRLLVGKPERKKKNLEGLGIDERIILKRTFRKTDGGMDRVYLAQDRDNHQDLLI